MGEMSDYYERYIENDEFYNSLHGDDTDYELWVTRDGDIIPVSELTNEHLVNIINYLHHHNPQDYWLTVLLEENMRRFNDNVHDATELDLY